MDNDILEVVDCSKNYEGFVLDSISFKVSPGKVVGLIGENGAGKTTIISMILNQIKRDSGKIKVFGLDNLEDEKIIKDNLGFVVDECYFHDCMNARMINSIHLKGCPLSCTASSVRSRAGHPFRY